MHAPLNIVKFAFISVYIMSSANFNPLNFPSFGIVSFCHDYPQTPSAVRMFNSQYNIGWPAV